MAKQNLRRRGKGWIAYIRVPDPETGKSRQVQRSFPTKDEAELWLSNARSKKIRREFRLPAKITFRAFAAEWLRDYALPHVSPRTFEAYEGSLRLHLVPHFGEAQLTDITRKALDEFVADWKAGGPRFQERVALARGLEERRHAAELERVRAVEAELAAAEGREPRYIAHDDVPRRNVRLGTAPGTISNALTPLREMLGHAVEWGYIVVNPAVGVKRPRVPKAEMHVLSPGEVESMLQAADPEWRTLLLTAVQTGLRQGELLAVRWGDVDWHSARLWVRRSVDRGGRFKEPKTAGSVRAVAMSPALVSALRRLQVGASRIEEGDVVPPDDDALVFPSETGGPLDGGNVRRRALARALRRAGLPQIRFHDLRHTYATTMLAHLPIKVVSQQLGHASVSITGDRYQHVTDDSYGDVSAAVEAAFFVGEAAEAASTSPAAALQVADSSFRLAAAEGAGSQ